MSVGGHKTTRSGTTSGEEQLIVEDANEMDFFLKAFRSTRCIVHAQYVKS